MGSDGEDATWYFVLAFALFLFLIFILWCSFVHPEGMTEVRKTGSRDELEGRVGWGVPRAAVNRGGFGGGKRRGRPSGDTEPSASEGMRRRTRCPWRAGILPPGPALHAPAVDVAVLPVRGWGGRHGAAAVERGRPPSIARRSPGLSEVTRLAGTAANLGLPR